MFARTVLVNGFRLSPSTGKLGQIFHSTSLNTGVCPRLSGSITAAIGVYRYKHTPAKDNACSSNEVIQRLLTQDGYAEEFVRSMGAESRVRLAQELRSHQEKEQAGMEMGKKSNGAQEIEPLTRDQYIKLMLRSGAPFVVFGFIDNSIMITAGEALDSTLGAALGLSTMAAAALGNLVSDVVGTSCGGMIQTLQDKIRLPNPHLTIDQRSQRHVAVVRNVSCVVGIAFGCVLGMFPLLF